MPTGCDHAAEKIAVGLKDGLRLSVDLGLPTGMEAVGDHQELLTLAVHRDLDVPRTLTRRPTLSRLKP